MSVAKNNAAKQSREFCIYRELQKMADAVWRVVDKMPDARSKSLAAHELRQIADTIEEMTK